MICMRTSIMRFNFAYQRGNVLADGCWISLFEPSPIHGLEQDVFPLDLPVQIPATLLALVLSARE